jgi:tryptophan synthase alpha chain
MADGPTIQAASERALAAGTTLPGILEMVRELRREIDTPMVLFSYYNVLFNYGIEAIAAKAADAGIDGMLIVDVPFEEMDEIRPALNEHGLHLISLVAPTTGPERARTILADARGFVYCITVTGVTGARTALPEELGGQLETVRKLSPVPVAAGFGISGPEIARATAEHADGVVVGSALVNRLANAETPENGIAECTAFVRELAEALKPGEKR